ncbi:hypothetical protein GDO78_007484 [Eleutherodactylus coqui]|uniref:Uncharacterized protein n=1 Tax=Eleutherodactylus coqui TaxID=57060 RepID=A0A8J6FJ87_ELECQ|nr:hypothetical protein GDO78_007484 [Eleutherodactylus coqui]
MDQKQGGRLTCAQAQDRRVLRRPRAPQTSDFCETERQYTGKLSQRHVQEVRRSGGGGDPVQPQEQEAPGHRQSHLCHRERRQGRREAPAQHHRDGQPHPRGAGHERRDPHAVL